MASSLFASAWQRMLHHLIDEEAWSDRDVVLLTNAENTMDKASEQRGSFKENRIDKENDTYIQEEVTEYQGDILKKEGLGNLTPTGHIESKRSE